MEGGSERVEVNSKRSCLDHVLGLYPGDECFEVDSNSEAGIVVMSCDVTMCVSASFPDLTVPFSLATVVCDVGGSVRIVNWFSHRLFFPLSLTRKREASVVFEGETKMTFKRDLLLKRHQQSGGGPRHNTSASLQLWKMTAHGYSRSLSPFMP